MDATLKCNIRKCRKALSTGQAWVTSCSHLFCPEDGEKYVVQEKKCPVCNHNLTGKLDIVRVDLNPSESFKSMVLCGLHPDVVMDISSRAVTFWMFQYHQEHLLKEHQLDKMSDKFSKMEKYCNKMMSNWQHEAKALGTEVRKYKHELGASKKRCEELNEVLREKTRQLQKLQCSYSAQRHSSLQKQSYSSLNVQESLRRGQKPQITLNAEPKQQFLSVFDLHLGVGRQTSPPQKDTTFEGSAFCYSASSIPPSPSIRCGSAQTLQNDQSGYDEGLPRKLFS